MNPGAEAQALLGPRYCARVLEPSPPAVDEPPWFADDPVAPGDCPDGRQLVSPVSSADITWEQLSAGDPELASWCADRWLGPYRRLGAVPAAAGRTREALHKLAVQVISPARRAANGKLGLRYTRGGFGTPFFGATTQVRVEGVTLVVEQSGPERRARITTLTAAADHIGRGLLPDFLALEDEPLEVEPAAAGFLADWFGFGASVLEELRARVPAQADPSRVQLWPEHFDIAIEIGSEELGARAAYGCSPGDQRHPEPYVYVAPWVAPPPGELWQAEAFPGAELPYAALLEAADQRAAALEFLRARYHALAA